MAYEVNERPVGGLRYAWFILLGLVVLTLRVVVRPSRVLGLKKFLVSGWQDGQRIWLSHPKHRDRISYPLIESTPSLEREAEVRALVVELIEDSDWMSLGELLVDWDEARAACPDNRRLIHLANATLVETLAGDERSPYDCAPRAVTRIPDAPVLELTALARMAPDVYALSAMAALILVHQCWDLRGQDYADAIPESHYDKMDQKVAQALTLLEAAGIGTRNSPLLNTVRLRLLPFLEDAESVIHEWFEATQRSDPGDIRGADFIGNMLLPRWFGDYQQIETTARQAAAWTGAEMGVAAYAIVYLSALEMEPIPLYLLDIDMFCEGIEDFARYRGHGADLLPGLSDTLHDLSQFPPPAGMPHEEQAVWEEKTHRIYLLGLSLLENHLTAIHPDSWRSGEAGALDMISLAMGRELEEGANLIVGPRGISAQMPEPVGDLDPE